MLQNLHLSFLFLFLLLNIWTQPRAKLLLRFTLIFSCVLITAAYSDQNFLRCSRSAESTCIRRHFLNTAAVRRCPQQFLPVTKHSVSACRSSRSKQTKAISLRRQQSRSTAQKQQAV